MGNKIESVQRLFSFQKINIRKDAKMTSRPLKLFFVLFAGSAFYRLVLFLEKILLSRYLGPHDFGVFSLSISIVNLALFFMYLGIPTACIRFYSLYLVKGEFEKINGLIKFSRMFSYTAGITTSIAVFILANKLGTFYNSLLLGTMIKIISPSIFLLLYTDVVASLYMGMSNPWYKFSREALYGIVQISFYTIGVLLLFNILYFPISYLISALIIFFIASFKYPKLYKDYSCVIEIREWLLYSLPIAFTSIFALFLGRVDNLILGKLIDMKNVGIYSVAYSLALLLRFVLVVASEAYFPLASSLSAEKSFSSLENLLKRTSEWVILITMPLFVIAFNYADKFIHLFFGANYSASIVPFRVLLVGHAFTILVGLVGPTLTAIGVTRAFLYIGVFSSVFNIILDLIFIRFFGISGAAIASAISLALNSLISFLFIKVKFNISSIGKVTGLVFLLVIFNVITVSFLKNTHFVHFITFVEVLLLLLFLAEGIKNRKDELTEIFPFFKEFRFWGRKRE